MRWILPLALLLFAGVLTLWPLVAVGRRPASLLRLFVEALGTTLAVIGLVWLAWAGYSKIEQRWWTLRMPC